MLSPVGSKQPLERMELEEGLVAYRCPETGGHWVPAKNYWKWQQSRPPVVEDGVVENGEQVTSEFDGELKLCPESQTFMSRYRVGHGLNFRVERSVTGGVWLDGGEWEALRQGNLHRSLHKVFAAPWQQAVRDEESSKACDEMLSGKLGEDLLGRVNALRSELADHPARAEVLAYLQMEDR